MPEVPNPLQTTSTQDATISRLPVPYDLVIDQSVPKILKGTIAAFLNDHLVGAELIRRFGVDITKVCVAGKKKGPPEMSVREQTVTMLVSPDAGLFKRFSQQLREPNGRAGNATRESERTRQDVTTVLSGVVEWAGRDFQSPRPSCLKSFMKESSRNPVKITPLLFNPLNAVSGLSDLQEFVSDGAVKRELKASVRRADSEAQSARAALRDKDGLLRLDAIKEHASAMARLGAASILQHIGGESASSMQVFRREIQFSSVLFEEQFTQRVARAIEASERRVLENFISAMSVVLDEWSNGGAFSLFSYTDTLMGQPTGWSHTITNAFSSYKARIEAFLQTHDDLMSTALASDIDIDREVYERVLGICPALAVPPGGDVRPFRAQFGALGAFLAGLAMSESPSHVSWFRTAYQGLFVPVDEKEDDSPDHLLGELKEMCVWARDPNDPRPHPDIHRSDSILGVVVSMTLFQAVVNTYERFMATSVSGTLESNRSLLDLLKREADLFARLDAIPSAKQYAALAVLLGSHREARVRADLLNKAKEFGPGLEARIESALKAHSCIALMRSFDPEALLSHKDSALDLLFDALEPLRALERDGYLGHCLTVAESALMLLDEVGERQGDLRLSYRAISEVCLNSLIESCREIMIADLSTPRDREDRQFELNAVRTALQDWRCDTTGILYASRQHVEEQYRKAERALKVVRS
jgi:hypothetical protein